MNRKVLLSAIACGSMLFSSLALAGDRVVCHLNVQGLLSASFEECTGIGTEHEIIEHKVMTASGQEVIRKIPGRLKYSDIILKKGIDSNSDIWDWRHVVETGGIVDARHNGSLFLVDKSGATLARWDFLNGWPSKLIGEETDDEESAGVEEMTLVVEYLERVE